MKHFVLSSLILLLILSACAPEKAVSSTQPPLAIASHDLQPTQTLVLPSPTESIIPTPIPLVAALRHGVNMSNALEAPNEGEWGLYIYEEYFDLVRQGGFDFVRLPVTWNGHADKFPPYSIDPAFFFRVDQVVEWALERGLNIIIELHSYNDMMSDPWGQKERFMSIWSQLSDHYKDYPPGLIFELLNEPNDQLNAPMWNEYIKETLEIIRRSNPTRDVIIGPVNWSTYDWVTTLDVPDDPHIIVTFHYYSPFDFTHQGAEWVEDSTQWLGTTWDATDRQKEEVVLNFDVVSDWSKRNDNVRILLGEFGAYSMAPQDSRIRWTTWVRQQAEEHGFAWAYWEFGAGFGVYDPSSKVWREDLLNVLIPKK